DDQAGRDDAVFESLMRIEILRFQWRCPEFIGGYRGIGRLDGPLLRCRRDVDALAAAVGASIVDVGSEFTVLAEQRQVGADQWEQDGGDEPDMDAEGPDQ